MPLLEASGLLARGTRDKSGKWLDKPLPKFGFHTLRHLQNSLVLQMGATLKEMMTRTGQSSVAAEAYVHLLRDPEFKMERRALSARVAEIIQSKMKKEFKDGDSEEADA